MSAFEYGTIRSGASPVMPGYANVLGQTGPNVSFIGMGPNQGTRPVARFLNMGVPSGPQHHRNLPSNDFIQHTYIAKPWIDDNAHLYIRDGMLVFVEKSMDPQMRQLSNVVALPKLNDVLERMHSNYRAIVTADPDQRLNEVQIEAYASDYDLDNAEKRDALKKAEQPVLRYNTMYGILNTWNFLGGVLTVPDPVTADDMYSYDGADKVTNLNVVLGKRIELANIWGSRRGSDGAYGGRFDDARFRSYGNEDPVDVGSRLWLILKRVRKDGPFKFMPHVTRRNATPRRADLRYEITNSEENTVTMMGKAIYVGTVTLAPSKDAPTGYLEAASGVASNSSGSATNWYEAHARVPTMEVQLGI